MCRNGDLSHGFFGSSESEGNMETGSDDSVDDGDDAEVGENGGETGIAMGIADDDDDDTRRKNSQLCVL